MVGELIKLFRLCLYRTIVTTLHFESEALNMILRQRQGCQIKSGNTPHSPKFYLGILPPIGVLFFVNKGFAIGAPHKFTKEKLWAIHLILVLYKMIATEYTDTALGIE